MAFGGKFGSLSQYQNPNFISSLVNSSIMCAND
jgi:hypothetical protein